MNIIDTHVDTITTLIDNSEFLYNNSSQLAIDKLNIFDKKGIYFAIWLSKERRRTPLRSTLNAIDFYYSELEKNKSYISHANSYNDFLQIFNSNKIASLLTIEGGEALENDINNLFLLHNKGVRLITLTWNNDNCIGSGVLGKSNGLTDLGKTVIDISNNLNIIIDVSHINTKGFFDVINRTKKPIIASHSNSYTVNPVSRNLSDEKLKALRDINSYVSFTLHSPFVNSNISCSENDILFHIDHLISILGDDYVSFGSDFDGTNLLPCEIKDISSMVSLYNLVKKTYNTDIANKIFYLNQLNFLKKVI